MKPGSILADPLSWVRRWIPVEAQDALHLPIVVLIRWPWLFYRQLQRDRAFIRAAGMAYATLIALVPTLMLVFGALHATGVLDHNPEAVEALIFDTFMADIPEVEEVLGPGLIQVDLRAMGVVGVAVLVFVATRLFLMIERAYSDIFGAQIKRPLLTRLLIFYFTATALPAVLIATVLRTWDLATGAGVAGVTVQHAITPTLQLVLLVAGIKLFPPTHVRWGPAISGGLVSFLLLHAGGQGFALYLRWFAQENPVRVIYGSLGVLPIFLLWLYLLWVFVLLGVEVAAVTQNYASLVEAELETATLIAQPVRAPGPELALKISALIGWQFSHGDGPICTDSLAKKAELQSRDVARIAAVLEDGGFVCETADGWVMSRPPAKVPLKDIVDTWRRLTAIDTHSEDDPIRRQIRAGLDAQLTGHLEDGMHRWFAASAEAQDSERPHTGSL